MSTGSLFSFHSEDIDYTLSNEAELIQWLISIGSEEGKEIELVEYIFCSDEFLLGINKEYLNHDYYTDIITFPLKRYPIEANVFVSIDRIKENAQLYNQTFTDELHRVIAHGLLHLLGYNDKSQKDEIEMRNKEDYYLDKRTFL